MKRVLPFLFFLFGTVASLAQNYTLENRFLIDVGVDDGSRGDATSNPDPSFNNYWNNLTSTAENTLISVIDTLGRATPLSLEVTDNFGHNGLANSGALENPSADELGDLAVSSATFDYFFVSGSNRGELVLDGLNEDYFYEIRVFGSRAAGPRTSQYVFTGSTVSSQILATSTNESELANSGLIAADSESKITIELTSADNTFAYINLIEIKEYSKFLFDESYYIDLSLTGSVDPVTASPDANGNHWNNLQSLTTSAYTAPLTLVNQDGSTAGGYDVSFKDFANSGQSNDGRTNLGATLVLDDLNVTTATTDYFFVTSTGSLLFENLDTDKAYRFDIYGYRATGITRISTYTITGENSSSHSLVSNNNTTEFITSDYIYPNSSGEIEISVGQDNTSFGYINLLKMSEFTPFVDVTSIALSGDNITSPTGTSNITADILPLDATNSNITWSVDNTDIAYINDEGELFPKNNGTVTVSATSVSNPDISGSTTINITNQILDFYVYGTALDGQPDGTDTDNAIKMMQMPGENGILTGIFTAYNAMDGDDTKSFQFFDTTTGSRVNYGINAGEIVENGFPIGISTTWTGPVRIRVDFSQTTATSQVLYDYQVTLRGNGLPNGFGAPGVELTYQADGIWSGTADFTNTPSDGGSRRFYVVTFDNFGNYREFWKLDGASNLLIGKFPDETGGQGFSTISLDDQVYTVTIDMQNQTYSIVNQTITENGIAFMGSSIADGFGAPNSEGYAFKYDSLLARRFADLDSDIDWTTTNISVGGDNTDAVLLRFYDDLLPTGMSYVMYGLALGNQGIISATDKQAVVDSYIDGLEELIDKARDKNIVPVVTNNYSNGFYDDEYPFVIDANIQMAQWDVPTINFLGALDDGTGKWPVGYQRESRPGVLDNAHTNLAGHNELFYSIVPSLFDALANDKPQPVKYANTNVTMDGLLTDRSFSFTPDGTVHAFTLSIKVKTLGNGTLFTLNQASDQGLVSINASDGTVDYTSPMIGTIDGTTLINDGSWHTVTLTHYYAAQRTILYIDGVADGETSELLEITDVALHSESTTDATSYSNLMFYRAGMTPQEVALIADDTKLLKSSMEVYAPLDGTSQTLPLLANTAQSTVTLSLDGLSADASLSDLTVSGESVTGFDANTLTYEVELPFGTTDALVVDATANDPKASFEVNAGDVPGSTTVVVTAENTAITTTYTVNWTLADPSTDALLSDLLIDNATIDGFDPNTLSYNVILAAGTTEAPTVTATVNDTNASYEVETSVFPGATVVTVTAQDGITITTYTVNFSVYVNVDQIVVTGDDITTPLGTVALSAEVLPATANDPSVTWSVNDASIAHVDDNGVVYPKDNGTVVVSATSLDNPQISGSFTVNISNQITAVAVYGTALEGGPDAANAIEMKQQPGENGILTGIFTAYNSMDGDPAKSFQFTVAENGANAQYGVVTSNQIAQGGFPIGISTAWTGPVRLRVDFTQPEPTYEVVWDYEVRIRGNGTEGAWAGDGVTLAYRSDGTWSGAVDFTFADNPQDNTVFRYQIITFDNFGNYRAFRKKDASVNDLVMFFPDEAGGQPSSEIRLAPGVYNITVDLQNQSYSYETQPKDEFAISFMGSSVAAGYPVPSVDGPWTGYAYKYDSLLDKRLEDNMSTYDWSTTNISLLGNATQAVLNRFAPELTSSSSSYVWYGLAMANEGLIDATDKQAIFDQYLSGMEQLIEAAREYDIIPVVSNNYPHGQYDDEYAYIIDANIEMAQWDVPTVNFLGALDDGTGQWAEGYSADDGHPNLAGYNEMLYSIVPSLFDALAVDKPQPVKYANTTMAMDDIYFGRQVTFAPEGTVHSFTTSVNVKTTGTGEIINLETAGDNAVLTIAGDGTVDYSSANAVTIDGTMAVNDGQWHTVTLTHYYAAGRTLLYIDGVADGTEVAEQLEITKVLLHEESTTAETEYSNLFFYRSGMTAEEIALVASDNALYKSSLEVYAPLDGLEQTLPVLTNLAQSTVELVLEGSSADARLASISINGNALGSFDPNTLDYTFNLPFGTTAAPAVTVTTADANATFELTAPGAPNGMATIVVTAENTDFTKTYTVGFSVANPGRDATLSSIRLDREPLENFASNTFDYTVELPSGTTEAPDIIAVASDSRSIVEVKNASELPGSATVVVIAEDKTTINIYTVNFRVKESLNGIIVTGANISEPLGTATMTAQLLPAGIENTGVTWSVDNEAVARIDENGVVYPKANGAVLVTATSNDDAEISGSTTINITNQITSFYLFGSGIEGQPDGSSIANSVEMKQMPGEDGKLTGIFTAYTYLAGDPNTSFQFYDYTSGAPAYYGVSTGSQIVPSGSAIGLSPEWIGPARIRVDFSKAQPTYEVVWDYQVVIRGNGSEGGWAGDGDTLTYAANGSWAGEVDFTFSDVPNDQTFFRYLVVTSDNFGNYREFRKIEDSSNAIAMHFPDESGGQALTPINLEQGVYNITIDLQNQVFFNRSTVTEEFGIAYMGSSVTAGFPVPTASGPFEGYAFKYDSLLDVRFDAGESTIDWTSVNISVGGNTTADVIQRFETDLLATGMSYVWYGLALGNEGILSATNKQATVDQFLGGMETLIDKARANDFVPVVANNYPNGFYDDEYEYVIDANIEMAQWDVPSINFLGALDDGTGKWVTDYQAILGNGGLDNAHPNRAGYHEMFLTIVPSMFDALAADKPQPVRYADTYVSMTDFYQNRRIGFKPEGTVHSFTLSLNFKTEGGGELMQLTTNQGEALIVLGADNGLLSYNSPLGDRIESGTQLSDGNWHTVTMTHYYAAQRTILYIDGAPQGELSEQLVLEDVEVHDEATTDTTDYSELFFYRSGMTPAEIRFLTNESALLKSSLEIYAPLDGTELELPVDANLAQSLNAIELRGISSDTRLNDITIDGVTLPGFSPAVVDYSLSVAVGADLPVIDAIAKDAQATVSIDGPDALPGTATVTVSSSDNAASSLYTINFTVDETPPVEVTLKLRELLVDGVRVSGFDPDITSYDILLPAGTTIVPEVIAIPEDEDATHIVFLPSRLPGAVRVEITSADEANSSNYRINFGLAGLAEDASLSNLSIDGIAVEGFDPEDVEYIVTLPFGARNMPFVTGVTNDNSASLTVEQVEGLPGSAVVTVRAENFISTRSYLVHFASAAASSDASLAELQLNGVPLVAFDPDETSYSLEWNLISMPEITAVTSSQFATASTTTPVTLPGTALIVVTAQDGSMREYSISIVQGVITSAEEDLLALLEVYPNPVVRTLTITGVRIEGYQLYDLKGHLLKSEESTTINTEIDMTDLTNGIYLLRVLPEGMSRPQTLKIIKAQ